MPADLPTAAPRPDLARHTGLSIVTLGVAAGPAIRSAENGIATAVVVDDHFYLVDFGLGCTRAAHEAGLAGRHLTAGFITHLHSDHVAELPSYLLFNWGRPVNGFERSVPVVGPGPDPDRAEGTLAGTADLLASIFRGFSYDIDIRIEDEGRPALTGLVEAREVPPASAWEGETTVVYRDDSVEVRATLVDHPPVNPAFAFRFDTAHGSVTLSGDTAYSPALAALAQGSDLLVHEAVNTDFYREQGFSGEFLTHQCASHSHPAEAGQVAAEASVGTLVLSHLAGRATPQWWREQAESTFSGPVVVATSGDWIRVGQRP